MRLVLEFGYNGAGYRGYQVQQGHKTIQGEMQRVISEFFGEDIEVVASGRTDAGVSAIRQVAHMDVSDDKIAKLVTKDFDSAMRSLAIRLNLALPEDIRILKIYQASHDFHARFSAKRKTYAYNFYSSEVEIPYLSQFALWVKYPVDCELIKLGLEQIIGTHDFTSFCSAATETESKVRTIYDAKIEYNNLGYYTIYVTGNGFLYNMVRIIVGTMLNVGRGKIAYSDIETILAAHDRTIAGKTVPANGLVLVNVEYND